MVADGYHAGTDGFVSLGVLLNACPVALGLPTADPIVAIAITTVILRITCQSWLTSAGDAIATSTAGEGRSPRVPDRSDQSQAEMVERRAFMLRRDPICQICGRAPSTEVDHRQAGDDHGVANLRGVCRPCHLRKDRPRGKGGAGMREALFPQPGGFGGYLR